MALQKVGLVGWRGMVGSVLMQRMQEEGDFDLIQPVFFYHLAKRAGRAAIWRKRLRSAGRRIRY